MMGEYPANELEQEAFDRSQARTADERLRNLSEAMVDDIMKLPTGEVLLEALSECFEQLRNERDFLKAQLAGERKNIAGWIAARDANLERATTAEARVNTLTGTLHYLRTQARNGALHPQVVIQNVDRVLGAED